jgi:DcaP outer membrane protein
MRPRSTDRAIGSFWLATALLIAAGPATARAQNYGTAPATGAPTGATSTAAQATPEAKPTFEIYGFAMLDIGQDHARIHPNWSDTLRLTRLPSFDKQYGEDFNTFAGVRQSRFGVRSSTPTPYEGVTLKTTFEFELFGVGVDEGQTTFRLRHAYGEIGHFIAGQTWSPFMDPDVFPNTVEYWGPTGMVLFRNVQFRYTAVDNGRHQVIVALERPGASGDQGVYNDRVELDGISARFPSPDISGAYKFTGDWGHARVGGIFRKISWDDVLEDEFDLSGNAVGWGVNLSSIWKLTSASTIRLQYVFGEGIQNYMNDSPIDIGIVNTSQNLTRPFEGEPIPITGLVAYIDHSWSEKFTSSFGYSSQYNDNTEGQAPDSFKDGHYVSGNLLYYPVPGVMVGGELQWGRRVNFSDGFEVDGVKAQFAFKYNFSWKLGG